MNTRQLAQANDAARVSPLIFALPGNEGLAQQLAQASGWQLGRLQTRHFPDGESNLRFLDEIVGRDVVLVCSLDMPNQKIMPLYFAASIARELGAGKNWLGIAVFGVYATKMPAFIRVRALPLRILLACYQKFAIGWSPSIRIYIDIMI